MLGYVEDITDAADWRLFDVGTESDPTKDVFLGSCVANGHTTRALNSSETGEGMAAQYKNVDGRVDLPSGVTPEMVSHLEGAARPKFIALLWRYRHMFAIDSSKPGHVDKLWFSLDTGESPPLSEPPRRTSFAEKVVIGEEINKMHENGIIRRSKSPWAAGVVLASKKDGSIRFCVDYRRLNKITKREVYPLPRIDDSLAALGNKCWFTSLDLASGYWQIPVKESDKEKTAFITHEGLWEFNVMPFGLTNAPATFQRMMDLVLAGIKWQSCQYTWTTSLASLPRTKNMYGMWRRS